MATEYEVRFFRYSSKPRVDDPRGLWGGVISGPVRFHAEGWDNAHEKARDMLRGMRMTELDREAKLEIAELKGVSYTCPRLEDAYLRNIFVQPEEEDNG